MRRVWRVLVLVGALAGVLAVAPAGQAVDRALARPAGVDLDVTYVSRTPLYNRYEVVYSSDGRPSLKPGTENLRRWPAHGEQVTFTAHVRNKGTVASGAFAFRWLVDDLQVATGTLSSLAPGSEATATYQWAWAHTLAGERLQGEHTVKFVADPANLIAETYETNNALADRTDAISLVFILTPEAYAAFETPVDPMWPFSAEDWVQKQVRALNDALARSVYPAAPQGGLERVRVDTISVLSEEPPTDPQWDGKWFIPADVRQGAYYNATTDIDGGLLHELAHQLGVIDLYAMNLGPEGVGVLDAQGNPVQFDFQLSDLPGLMINPGIQPPTFDEHSVLGLNANKGCRRGYYGEYQYDLPAETYLRILNSEGQPEPGITVRLFQVGQGQVEYGGLGGWIDNEPEIEGITNAQGKVLLASQPVGLGASTNTGHTLRANPFGIIDVVGTRNTFLVSADKGSHQEFFWLNITALNLAFWRSGSPASLTVDIASHVGGTGAQQPPLSLVGQQAYGNVRLDWQASVSPTVAGYNVYRTSNGAFPYERVATGIDGLSYSEHLGGAARVATYVVTAVDGLGAESGFSDPFYAFPLLNPAAVAVDARNQRVVLDPKNGYALYFQDDGNVLRDTRGSVHLHLEYSRYIAITPEGRYLISHPADYYTSNHSVRLLNSDFELIDEFGSTGAGPGQFHNPAGVTAWGAPCPTSGLYSDDANTQLLVHFDGVLGGTQGEQGTASGTSYADGRFGQAVAIDNVDMLWYPTAGNIVRTQGAIEFWVRPHWEGNDGINYSFFEVGSTWFNRMKITKDGANNLRFILWDDHAEYGVAHNIADWSAGEWHHVAVTWAGSEIALYVDGVREDESSTANVPLSLGTRLYVGSTSSGTDQADADLDEFRISDVPRVGFSQGCVYCYLVVDSGNGRVSAFNSEGGYISAFGQHLFSDPQGIAVLDNGDVVVADSGDGQIRVLSFDGTAFALKRTISAGLSNPTGIAAYGTDRIVVADTGHNQIKILDAAGSVLSTRAVDDDGAAFASPLGVAVDRIGRIIVADTGNKRIAVISNALPPPPSSFGKVAPADGSTGQSLTATLSWEASAGVMSYEYCLDTTDNDVCDGVWRTNGEATSTPMLQLALDADYYWQVRAINSYGTTYADGDTWWHFTAPQSAVAYSLGGFDGWVLEKNESSGKGGTFDATATTARVGDDASDRQYRSVLHFDTSSLPDNAVITGVTLRIKKQSVVGTNPFDTHGFLTVDMKTGAFHDNPALEKLDFQAVGSRGNVGRFVKTPALGWYRAPLRAVSYPLINLTGTTQFRLRFTADDNDDMGADYLSFYTGEAAEADRPELIVTYYVP